MTTEASIKLTINGKSSTVPNGTTVQGLVDLVNQSDDNRGLAVAVNAEVVPRSGWSTKQIAPGAEVEVLQAIQGG